MENRPAPLKPKQLTSIILDRRWCVIVPFCLTMMAGIYFALTLPKTYRAETMILVEPQRVPTDYVQSIVSMDINSRIGTISQQILSRTNLEKIIEEFKLYSEPEARKMFLEDRIDALRQRILVDVSRAPGRNEDAQAFTIAFEGHDPRQVMNVANALARYFIDENLKVREAQAIGTSNFLNEELVEMRDRLEGVEQKLKDYRTAHMGELPEQLDSNLQILTRLQDTLNQQVQNLRDAKIRIQFLEGQEIPLSTQYAVLNRPETGPAAPSELERLRRELLSLESRYTDGHPDVIKLRQRIAELQAETQETEESETEKDKHEAALDEKKTSSPTQAVGPIPPEERARRLQIENEKNEIKSIEFQISEIKQNMKIYQKRVEAAPRIEQDLMTLRRDYENIQRLYNSLLSRKLEAEIAVNMEKKQKGEQFRIVDSAKLPHKPVAPNMKKLFMLAVAAGLGIAAGIIFLVEFFKGGYRVTEEIEESLGIPVLVEIPILAGYDLKRFRKVRIMMSAVGVLVSVMLFSGFAMISLMGEKWVFDLLHKIKNL